MNATRIDHIGIAVYSIDACLPFYEKALGLTCRAIEEVPDQKVRTAFFHVGSGETRLELSEPATDDSPLLDYLHEHGEGLQYVAFRVPDTDDALDDLRSKGEVVLLDQLSRRGCDGCNIAYVRPQVPGGFLTQLCSDATPEEPQDHE